MTFPNVKSLRILMLLIFSGLILINLSSCKGGEGDTDDDKDSTATEETQAEGLKPGMTPFDFPTVGMEANVFLSGRIE